MLTWSVFHDLVQILRPKADTERQNLNNQF